MITSVRSLARAWNSFWFEPESSASIALVRGLLCLVAIGYFAESMLDASFWAGGDAPFSRTRLATFLHGADLESHARWILSPLFLIESVLGSSDWLPRAYLAFGIATGVCVLIGRGGRLAPWMLWIVFVGWANRLMLLSGVGETLLSLALFGTAIAPPQNSLKSLNAMTNTDEHACWQARFSGQLVAVTTAMFGWITLAAMLSQDAWRSGKAAYLMTLAADNSTMSLSHAFSSSLINTFFSYAILIMLPAGLLLTWSQRGRRTGVWILLLWCAAIAVVGSHWLYGATFAAMCLTLRRPRAKLDLPAR